MYELNEKGLTLIELLAVVVITGIISGIAILSISGLIDRARKDAFIQNAYTLKEAAEMYARDEHVHENDRTRVTYEMLYNENLLEKIKDPFTKDILDPEDNDSYVVMAGLSAEAVCLRGVKKNICSEKDGETYIEKPVPYSQLSLQMVFDNQ